MHIPVANLGKPPFHDTSHNLPRPHRSVLVERALAAHHNIGPTSVGHQCKTHLHLMSAAGPTAGLCYNKQRRCITT